MESERGSIYLRFLESWPLLVCITSNATWAHPDRISFGRKKSVLMAFAAPGCASDSQCNLSSRWTTKPCQVSKECEELQKSLHAKTNKSWLCMLAAAADMFVGKFALFLHAMPSWLFAPSWTLFSLLRSGETIYLVSLLLSFFAHLLNVASVNRFRWI